MGSYYETYGQLNRKIHLFYTHVSEQKVQNLDQDVRGYEDIEVILVPFEEVINLALDNKIDAMGSTLAVLLLQEKLK